MRFIESVFEKLKRHPKRIVFPEGAEPRVLEAAGRFSRMQLGAPILLGDVEVIERKAEQYGIDLARIGIIDPTKAEDLPMFASRLERLQRYRNIGAGDAREILTQPELLRRDDDPARPGGRPGRRREPVRQLADASANPDRQAAAGDHDRLELHDDRGQRPSVFGAEGMLMFADCAVVPEPTVEQLASIGIETAKVCRQLTGIRPRVAFLSFSTKGSSRLPAASKMAAAAALARQKADTEKIEMEIDGELQADTALLPELAAVKAPCEPRGRATRTSSIFPDLNSGNIAAKLVQHLGGASAYGQVLARALAPGGGYVARGVGRGYPRGRGNRRSAGHRVPEALPGDEEELARNRIASR